MGIEIDALLQYHSSDTKVGVCRVNLKCHKWRSGYAI
jgi:hypothetical protein